MRRELRRWCDRRVIVECLCKTTLCINDRLAPLELRRPHMAVARFVASLERQPGLGVQFLRRVAEAHVTPVLEVALVREMRMRVLVGGASEPGLIWGAGTDEDGLASRRTIDGLAEERVQLCLILRVRVRSHGVTVLVLAELGLELAAHSCNLFRCSRHISDHRFACVRWLCTCWRTRWRTRCCASRSQSHLLADLRAEVSKVAGLHVDS